MATLYELHNQGQDRSVYTCNNCEKHVEMRYHCTVCPDFDVCVNCFNKDGHQHKMEKLGFGLDDDSASGDQKQTNPRESRLLSVQRCIESLVHACQCRDANCRLPSCQKMKKLVQHVKSCMQKTNGSCPICKQYTLLCCYHAKHCQKDCPVLFCVKIRNVMRQQQLQKRLPQILKRRIATVQNREMPSAVLQPSPGNSNSIGNSSMGPPQVMPNPGPSIAGMQSPTQAWQQLLQILKSPASAQQQQQVLAFLKANPQIMAAFMKHRIAQQQQQQHQQLQLQQQQQQQQAAETTRLRTKELQQ